MISRQHNDDVRPNPEAVIQLRISVEISCVHRRRRRRPRFARHRTRENPRVTGDVREEVQIFRRITVVKGRREAGMEKKPHPRFVRRVYVLLLLYMYLPSYCVQYVPGRDGRVSIPRASEL